MKLAFVANTAWNIRNFRLGLMHFLQSQGYEVVAIAPPDDSVQVIENEGFKLIQLEKLSRKGSNPLADLSLLFELKSIFQREKIDIALLYTVKPNIYGSLAAKLSGARTICTVTGLGYAFLNPGLINKVVKRLYRFAFGFSDKILFQNHDDFELFVNSGLARAEKCGIVPGSGIDTNSFAPEPKPQNQSPTPKTCFLFIGRLLYDKGIREFFEAAQIFQQNLLPGEFQILGTLDKGNPAAISETELAEKLKNSPNVRYLGSTNDTRPFIAAADAVVLPSYREGLPRVNLEAMSMAKPVITTNVPGCRDTVEDGENGFLVEVESGASLAEGLKKFLALSPGERFLMGEKSRQMAVNQFDMKIVQRQYLEILGQLAAVSG